RPAALLSFPTRRSSDLDDLKMALMDHMTNCRVRSAIELAASHPSYLGRMMAYSLPNIDATRPEDLGRDQIEDAIADFSINENRKDRKSTRLNSSHVKIS